MYHVRDHKASVYYYYIAIIRTRIRVNSVLTAMDDCQVVDLRIYLIRRYRGLMQMYDETRLE